MVAKSWSDCVTVPSFQDSFEECWEDLVKNKKNLLFSEATWRFSPLKGKAVHLFAKRIQIHTNKTQVTKIEFKLAVDRVYLITRL
jgi:hypothetical protein